MALSLAATLSRYPVDVTVLGLVGVAPGGETPRVADSSAAGAGRFTITGTGRHRVQIIYFFRMQIGSRTPSGIGLGSGGRRYRMSRCLGVSREIWIENLRDLYWRTAQW